MPAIEPIHLELADATAQQLVRAAENRIGQPTNMLRTMAHSPSILETYLHFNRAFEQTKMTTKLSGLVTIAIAQAMGCECILSVAVAFGVREGLSLEELEAARHIQSDDPKVAAALGFAVRAIEAGGKVDPASVAILYQTGYSDEEIVEIIGAISLNLFRNFFNLIVQTEVDFPHVRTSEPIQKGLGSQVIPADR
jgi:alkylhydroperoxidase family enzyme